MAKNDKVEHPFVPRQGSSLCHYQRSVSLFGVTIVSNDLCLRPRWKHIPPPLKETTDA
ncbi:hypothetical protein SEA_SKOG_117 [Gordonia phage Skog]|uniref:Uncharacterized protein n=1 Tax=Gordonia phage Skog TaxID=2704033 RepID=A0A6G6XJH9_9CAUD|nr:hypothetical protein KHQ85_gp117 [Gordonia phage Skog]QIG58269.1 hypothetical protein SEA_SKOG_117 [Gordonia phage Skog]